MFLLVIKSAKEAVQFLGNQELYQAHRDAESNILRELGARYFKVLKIASESGFEVPKIDAYKSVKNGKKITQKRFLELKIDAYKSVKNGKKITQKRFLELVDLYIDEVLNYRASVRSAKAYIQRQAKVNAYTRLGGQNKQRKLARVHYKLDGKMLDRASLIKERRIRDALFGTLDLSVSGDLSVSVVLTNDPEQVSYDSYTDIGEQYSRSCTYRKTDLHVTATFPKCWWSRVAKQDLIHIDGLFNMDVSTPLVGDFGENVEVRAATWLVKSRGTSYNVVKGFIARDLSQEVAFHGKTLKSALQGLHRKLDLQDAMSITTNDTNKIIERAKRSIGLVYLSDSYKVGNCQWGTLDFAARHNIDLSGNAPHIPISEFAKIVEREPRREALAVLLYAIKRRSRLATPA
ncbi:hypothetical protein ACP3V3_19830 [Vibrio sp. PNB22_3_1]